MEARMDAGANLVMLPRDAPTDVLNELQLVQDFYGADAPADHQRVMALFAPHARLDLPHMFVAGRDNISAVMFYAKAVIADIDIEPYMVEIAVAGAGAGGGGHGHHTATTSTAPTSSTTSTDSTSSTCTSAATSKRRRPGGKPPKAPSAGAAAAAGTSNGAVAAGGRSRLGRSKHQQPVSSLDVQSPPLADVARLGRAGRAAAAASDLTDQLDGGTAQNGASAPGPQSMSRTYVYAVATITPKALPRMLTLNLLPREIRLRTRITLVWDDEAGEVLLLQERPDNLPVGLVPQALKRAVGRGLGFISARSQWLLGRLAQTQLVAGRWPGLAALYGTGL